MSISVNLKRAVVFVYISEGRKEGPPFERFSRLSCLNALTHA